MKNVINRALEAKKKLFVLALSAVMVMSVSAQEQKREFKEKKLSKEERIEKDIQHLTRELMLSDAQAEKFAVTFREYAAKKAELFEKNAPKDKEPRKELSEEELDKMAQKRFEARKKLAELDETYYAKFRKDLSARQVAKVLRANEPCGKKDGAPGREGCPKKEKKHGPKPDAPKE